MTVQWVRAVNPSIISCKNKSLFPSIVYTSVSSFFFHIIWSFSTQIFERFGALDLRCMLVLEYIWIFEYPQVFFAGYLDIWSLGAALPRGQGGKIGNLPNQQPPRAPEIVPHKKRELSKYYHFF